MLNTVIVHLENGEKYSTNVSAQATEDSCREYFIGKFFDMGVYPQEKLVKCKDIKFIKGTSLV